MPTQLPTDNIAPKPEQMTTKSSVGSSAVGQPQATVGAGQAVTGQAPGANYGTSTTGVRDQAMEAANKQKMIASGQLDPETLKNAQLTQEKINMFTYGAGAPIFGATDSSDKATDETNKTMEDVTGQLATTQAQLASPDYKYYTDYDKEMRDSRDQARDLYDEVKANIEKDFSIRRTEQDTENRIMTGTQSKALARMGALSRSTSGMSYLQDVDRTNQEKINKLLVQKEKLLLEATAAYLEQDWNKLETIMSENKKVVDQYNQVQKWKLEDSMATQDQLMEQAKFGWEAEDRAAKKMSDLAMAYDDLSKVPKEEKAKLEKEAGYTPGYFDQLFDYAQQEKVSKKLEIDSKMAEFLSKIPAGKTIQIGDTTYTGIENYANNDASFQVITDGVTNKQKLLTTRKDGTFTVTDLGIKGEGTAGNYTPTQLTALSSNIASAYPDGKVGGECGEFVHNIVATYPYGLDLIEQKVAQVDESIGLADFQSPPQVGDVVIQTSTGASAPYGHVSVINSYDPNTGIMTLTESNYYEGGVISNTRTLNASDAAVKGFYRGTLRSNFISGGKTGNEDEKKLLPQTAFTPEEYNKIDSYFNQWKGSDGKVNTEVYANAYNNFVATYENGDKLFIEKYPPRTYLNSAYDVNKFYINLQQ